MEENANTTAQPANHAKNNLRKWATPLTIGLFALTAFTGILIFLNVHLGLLKHVHEWASILFVLACGLHIVLNWRPMQRYFSQTHTKVILAVVAVLIGVSLLPVTDNGHGDHGRHGRQGFSATQVPAQLQGHGP